MSVSEWVVVGILTLGAVSTVASVGKERKPLTPGVAAVGVAIDIIVIAAILFVGH